MSVKATLGSKVQATLCLRIEKAALAKAHVGMVADDDVIEDVDAEEFACCREASRDLVVLWARRRVSAGVIVREDYGRRVREDRRFEHFARMDERRIEGAATDLVVAEDVVLRRQ